MTAFQQERRKPLKRSKVRNWLFFNGDWLDRRMCNSQTGAVLLQLGGVMLPYSEHINGGEHQLASLLGWS